MGASCFVLSGEVNNLIRDRRGHRCYARILDASEEPVLQNRPALARLRCATRNILCTLDVDPPGTPGPFVVKNPKAGVLLL